MSDQLSHQPTSECSLYCAVHGERMSHPCCLCTQHDLDTAPTPCDSCAWCDREEQESQVDGQGMSAEERQCRERWGHYSMCPHYPNRAALPPAVESLLANAEEQLDRRDPDGRISFFEGLERLQATARAALDLAESLLAAQPPGAGERVPLPVAMINEHEHLCTVMVRIAKAVGYDSPFMLEMTCEEGESPAEKVASAVERLAADSSPGAQPEPR